MTPDPVIRPATDADADGIAVVHVRSWQQTYASLVPRGALDDLDPTPRAAMWRRVIADPATTVTVAVVDGVIVGWAATAPARDDDPPRELELVSLYVLSGHHGTDAGQGLLDAVLDAAPAYLWVADPNPRAEAFYRRNGFIRDGAASQHRLAGHPVPAVRMVR